MKALKPYSNIFNPENICSHIIIYNTVYDHYGLFNICHIFFYPNYNHINLVQLALANQCSNCSEVLMQSENAGCCCFISIYLKQLNTVSSAMVPQSPAICSKHTAVRLCKWATGSQELNSKKQNGGKHL